MPDPPLVYSVVLTWNNFDDTDECLQSLAKQTHPNHRILVIDNGSADGSGERLRAMWSGSASFILSTANLGCGGGYALGARTALKPGRLRRLIDNDIVADRACSEPLQPLQSATGSDDWRRS
jgi:GT2 family glycosyltransferase